MLLKNLDLFHCNSTQTKLFYTALSYKTNPIGQKESHVIVLFEWLKGGRLTSEPGILW